MSVALHFPGCWRFPGHQSCAVTQLRAVRDWLRGVVMMDVTEHREADTGVTWCEIEAGEGRRFREDAIRLLQQMGREGE